MELQAKSPIEQESKSKSINIPENNEKISNSQAQPLINLALKDLQLSREKLEKELARMCGGVSIIHVGGRNETEMNEKKDRVDDALHATKAAIEEGIVPGGGAALLYAREVLPTSTKCNEKLGAEKLFSKLEEIDPVYSKKVHLNNKKRLIRALEIYMTTGKSPSVHFDSQKKRTTSLLNLFTVLLTVDKKKLCEKIEKRTNMMINNGWVEESKKSSYIKN